jgi:hypothetical protein
MSIYELKAWRIKSEKDGDLVKMSEVLQFRAASQAITLPTPFNIDPKNIAFFNLGFRSKTITKCDGFLK